MDTEVIVATNKGFIEDAAQTDAKLQQEIDELRQENDALRQENMKLKQTIESFNSSKRLSGWLTGWNLYQKRREQVMSFHPHRSCC